MEKNKKLEYLLEVKNDFALLVTKQPLFTEPVWNPKIIRPMPVVINHREKKHTWHLASFDKKILMEVYKFAKKYLGVEMLKFKEEKISNISITHLLPELTEKQKHAMGLAIQYGYYDYPKKIELEKLAKIMKISYSTFQAHLRKAEGRIVPQIYKEL